MRRFPFVPRLIRPVRKCSCLALLSSASIVAAACNGGMLNAGYNRADEGTNSPQISPPLGGGGDANVPTGIVANPGPMEPTAPAASDADASVPMLTGLDAGPPTPAAPAASEGPATTPDAAGGPLDDGGATWDGLLPVGPSSPMILSNDGAVDNWQGEYALLLAQAGTLRLAGIVVGTGSYWPDLEENLSGWRDMIASARDSGMTDIPDPVGSQNPPLERPPDAMIASTVPNGSEGARLIVDKSLELARPDVPVVVATGGSLTDVADAYLLDPTVADRVVVVASLGTGFSETEPVAKMGVPNGEQDAWADEIVARRFRYVQVSAYYNHRQDVPEARLGELPENPFGDWIRAKQPNITAQPITGDQVSVIALGLPDFASTVERVSLLDSTEEQPTLGPDPEGNVWLVTDSDGTVPASRLWELLEEPTTFGP
jgi:hypothetical protein